ncbi:signal peptide peptidase domain-containing protein [Trichoderma breve]|uniref:Signal peptide peptidase domain-containing protein n=1 Tax=Trichoderma breve TaxID=2034170 RepID=A0A9W9E5T2_9HYPO|nr:signal peptide peptidase domain-containing protein [Trichoderma breve]KAJ4858500.1 signal peptide peptidase domain-containing protein [Trichoderma breve]
MAATNVTLMEGLDSLNVTLNTTASAASPTSLLDTLQDVSFLLLELKLVSGAMGIIYLGAHGSLRRPPSAAVSKDKKRRKQDDETFSQGLELSDAILFPIMAACVLVGLYYLIQWLQDPAIINKILRSYMTTMSMASLLTFYAHGIQVLTSFVFPRFWRGRDGKLRRVDQAKRTVAVCDDAGNEVESLDAGKANPLPGALGFFTPVAWLQHKAWNLRDLLTRHWLLEMFVHGMGKETAHVKFAHMMALLMAVVTAIVYFATSWPFLSNMLGYGMCYGSFLILSPTDFLTGSLVLWGLFFYDIFMVFYTPYMVTVATTLDVPIKLTYEAASRKSILGLGDIVIPGMVIGWALRLDLWIHYYRKIRYESTDLKIIEKDSSSGESITRRNWGERIWTRQAFGLVSSQTLPAEVAASRFPKTYFYASMVGYFLGMLVTLAMLLIFKHGQPALLYLVPGVLGSLLLTSLVRGEFKELWMYTEDGSLDTVDVVVDLDGDGKAIKTIGKLEDGVVDTTKDEKKKDEEKKDDEKEKDKSKEKKAPSEGAEEKDHDE